MQRTWIYSVVSEHGINGKYVSEISVRDRCTQSTVYFFHWTLYTIEQHCNTWRFVGHNSGVMQVPPYLILLQEKQDCRNGKEQVKLTWWGGRLLATGNLLVMLMTDQLNPAVRQ